MVLWCYDVTISLWSDPPSALSLICWSQIGWIDRTNQISTIGKVDSLSLLLLHSDIRGAYKKKGNCNSMLSDNARLPGFHVELSLQVQIHSDDDFYSSSKHFPKIWGLGMGCIIIIIIIGMQINLFWTSLPFCVHFLQEKTARSTFIKQRPHPPIFCTNRHRSQWVQSICW